MRHIKYFSIFCFLALFSLTACTKTQNNAEPISRMDFLIGTTCSVKIYDSKDASILDACFDRIKQIEKEVSVNEDGTEVDKINENAGIQKVPVSDDTYFLIKRAMYYAALSDGSFDVTVGPVTSLWHIGFDDARVPSKEEIDAQLKYIGYKNVVLDDASKTVFLTEKNMKLDLGGIAKGFVADEVVKVLKSHGVKKAIVDLGGNIVVVGNNPNNSPWSIGVQDPFLERNEVVGILKATEKSLVTSGIYERYIEKDGVYYHHILSPFDGYPINNEIAGITIISDLSTDGDALSTTVFSKGLQGGIDFVNKLDGVEAVFITKDKKVHITKGLKNIFNLTNDSYTME